MNRKRGEEKRKRKKKKRKSKGMELVWKCYDFVWKLLGYGLLAFSMDSWILDLVP